MRLLATCLTAIMALPLPPPEANPPARVDPPAADTRAVIEDSKSLLQHATELCGTAGFAEGTAANEDCTSDFLEALATSLTPTKVPPDRQAKVAEGSNLGVACGSYFPSDLRLRERVYSTEFLFWVDADGRVRAGFIEVPSGDPRLDNAAFKCIKATARFVPHIVGGKPPGSWQHMKWTWRLAD